MNPISRRTAVWTTATTALMSACASSAPVSPAAASPWHRIASGHKLRSSSLLIYPDRLATALLALG